MMAFQPKEMTHDTLRRMVDNLVRHCKNSPLPVAPKRSQLQEAVAHILGFSSYHEATVHTKKNVSPSLPAPQKIGQSQKWHLPQGFLLPRTKELPWPSDWPHQKKEEPLSDLASFTHEDFAQSVLMLAPEHKRKIVFQTLCDLNPHQRFYVIQGPMSLIPTWHKARQIKTQSLDAALAHGRPSDITDHLIFYFGSSSPDSLMWQGRAIAMMSSIVAALVYLRDHQNIRFDASTLLKNLELINVIELSNNPVLPPQILQSLKSYLRSLPTYQEGVEVQSNIVNEQHGYLKMQFTHILSKDSSGLKTMFEVRDPASLDFNNVQCFLPERPLIESEIQGVKQSIKHWSRASEKGLVFVDIPFSDQSFWSFFINQLPHLLEAGHPVWVGLHSDADIPSSLRQMLTRRIKHIIQDIEYQYRR